MFLAAIVHNFCLNRGCQGTNLGNQSIRIASCVFGAISSLLLSWKIWSMNFISIRPRKGVWDQPWTPIKKIMKCLGANPRREFFVSIFNYLSRWSKKKVVNGHLMGLDLINSKEISGRIGPLTRLTQNKPKLHSRWGRLSEEEVNHWVTPHRPNHHLQPRVSLLIQVEEFGKSPMANFWKWRKREDVLDVGFNLNYTKS